MDDPAYRFTVVYKDGREMSQEGDKGVVVKDHCHVEDWNNVEIYSLRNRPGDHVLSVNFVTGDFSINGMKIKMMLHDMDLVFGAEHNKANFKPIYGRTHFRGDWGSQVFYKLGWQTELEGKIYKRVLYVDEYGQVYFNIQ